MSEDGSALIAIDPWLAPYADRLRDRIRRYHASRERIEADGGLLGPISQGHTIFGLNRGERDGAPGVWYREWAPGASYLALIGDFNGWDRGANPLERGDWGVWSTFLPDAFYAERLVHGGRIKVHVASSAGGMDRIPAYIRRVVQAPDHSFTGQYWQPEAPFVWQQSLPPLRTAPRVYEAHVGMAQEERRVGSYTEFSDRILPRIADLGYNAVQLMAVMEHPYYGSFGYHVSNLFAASSRFGTPEALKALIDTAHGLGLHVIMDIVHSHMVKNDQEGLNRFDGTDFQYFHAGARGEHVLWDSLCYDYAKYEVQRLLLSSIRFWLEEYHFDGFRFDGVTSMLYLDHGVRDFTRYDDYFNANVDDDAVVFLMLANATAKAVQPGVISIAEEVSGMPGLARPVSEGGLGFDYRLAMGVPDYWIKMVRERRDEEWNLGEIYHTLLNRRPHEKHIGYVESHDQALVGDKTMAFWLMDEAMYSRMSRSMEDLIVARGMALHKMIRLLTFSLGGEGYLSFMGNEFGHPEWIDFPREGNGFSYEHARRQWSLVERDDLRYQGLYQFDKAMQHLGAHYALLEDPFIEQLALHEDTRQLIYRRGPLLFAFNFHTTESYSGLRIPAPDPCDYEVVLNTDDLRFDGRGLVAMPTGYPRQAIPMYGRAQSLQIYLPARSAQVLAPIDKNR